MMNMVEELSVLDFTEYVKPNLSWLPPKQSLPPEEDRYGWVFWSSESDQELFQYESENQNPIQKKVQLLIQEITKRPWEEKYLVQFWAPEMVGGKFCLKTSNQPFGFESLCKGLCWYRKQCMEHQYFVDQGAKEEEIGPPGRVFRTGHPESTPDLRLYSSQQYSLRCHAARYGLRRYMAFPVFDLLQDKCIGVLEVVSFFEGFSAFDDLETIEPALKASDLRPNHINFPPCLLSGHLRRLNNSEAQKLVLSEIKEMLELVIKLPQLHLAQVWIPCSQCPNTSINLSCMEQALFMADEEKTDWVYHQFIEASQFHRVQTGNGVAGRVLSSPKKSCFCQNLCDFNITEFPLAHYAQKAKLTKCFTICLQSSHSTENDFYLIQFFLHAGNTTGGYTWSFLHFLVKIMEIKLKSFKFANREELGEELVVEVMEFYKGNEHTLVEIDSSKFMYPLKFEVAQYGQEMEHHQPSQIQRLDFTSDNIDSTRNVVDREEVTTKKAKRKRNKTSFHISYEDLRPHFEKRLEDAAQELGVSKSTLKRASRNCGIDRWPSNEKNKKNLSLFETTNTETRVGGKSPLLNSPICKSVSQNNVNKNSEHVITMLLESTEVVIIKAKFNDDIIKFQFCISSRMEELEDQVARRLKFEIGSFRLKYLDEDGQWILLTCDEDLQLCLTSLGKTPVQLLVQLIGN